MLDCSADCTAQSVAVYCVRAHRIETSCKEGDLKGFFLRRLPEMGLNTFLKLVRELTVNL